MLPPLSCRYSPENITPSTTSPDTTDTTPSTCQLASFCRVVKVLTSPQAPTSTRQQPDNTHGQEKIPNSIMIVIIIMISIRLRYILKNTHKNTV